jgi:hypothetical protein
LQGFAKGAYSAAIGAILGAIVLRPSSAAPSYPELLVQAIVHAVHCEVRDAVIHELGSTKDPKYYPAKPYSDFMKDWGAEVALTLTIDEKSTLAPSGIWMPTKIFNPRFATRPDFIETDLPVVTKVDDG